MSFLNDIHLSQVDKVFINNTIEQNSTISNFLENCFAMLLRNEDIFYFLIPYRKTSRKSNKNIFSSSLHVVVYCKLNYLFVLRFLCETVVTGEIFKNIEIFLKTT